MASDRGCSDATRCTCLPLPEPVNDTCPVHGDGMEAPDATTNPSTARFDGMEAPDESTRADNQCNCLPLRSALDGQVKHAPGCATNRKDDDASRPTFHYTDEDVAQNYEVGKRHGAEAERARIVAILRDNMPHDGYCSMDDCPGCDTLARLLALIGCEGEDASNE